MPVPGHKKVVSWLVCVCCAVFLQACKHPLAIIGEGDIVDTKSSGRGCTLEQFQSGDSACTENEVTGDYFVNYKAEPRPGWRFVGWEGPCSPNSPFQHCSLGASKEVVDWWEEMFPDLEIPASTAVFQRITGETGYLLAGTPVAGVTYKTPTQQGVTGLDGGFQYGEGETVRFMIGDTLLGEVTGQGEVTPFDLAGSPVLKGIEVSWALGESPFPPQSFEFDVYDPVSGKNIFERPHPFNTVVNVTVMLYSLDEDAEPGNGIVIRPGVASLFDNVSLDLRQEWMDFLERQDWPRDTGEYRDLHYKIGEANKKHRFSAAHGVVSPATAMQVLYETLDIDSRTYVTCPKAAGAPPGFPDMPEIPEGDLECRYDTRGNLTILEDQSWEYDADGRVIKAKDGPSVERFQYDTFGNKVLSSSDLDGDGVPESVEYWTYDAYGNTTRYEEDHDGDGAVDSIARWTYDEKGRPQAFEAEGHTSSWKYNAGGALIGYQDIYADVDHANPESSETWSYNSQGAVTLIERMESDPLDAFVIAGNEPPGYDRGDLYRNGSRLPSSEINDIAFITYVITPDPDSPEKDPVEDQGQIFSTGGTVPLTGDQLSQSITTGISGQLAGIQIQWNSCIPVPSPRLKFSVVSGPNPPRGTELYSEEIDLTGVDTSDNSLYTWDLTDADLFFERGEKFTFVLETLSAGTRCSRNYRTELAYGPDGNVTKRAQEKEGEIQPGAESIEHYQFDTQEHLLRYEMDFEGDEVSERVDQWEYDSAGNLTRYEYFREFGEEGIDSWRYDEEGRPLRHEKSGEDGQIVDETWEYDGEGKLVQYRNWQDVNGASENSHRWEYDENGNLVRHEFNKAEGELLFERWIYGSGSELIRYERNYDYYEQPGEIMSWEYRSSGWGHVFNVDTPALFECGICYIF